MTTRGHLAIVAAFVAVLALSDLSAQAPQPTRITRERIDTSQLLADLQRLSADDMEGRRLGTPGNQKAREYIVTRFTALGLTPVGASFSHPFAVAARRNEPAGQGVNVIGQIEGTTDKAHYLVISAHYDHVGVRNGVVFNGADDNGSGTAALFALAHYFLAHRPRHSLLFVAFDGEEAGLFGSRAFVRNPPVDRGRLLIDLNADMIARDRQNTLWVTGTAAQPHLAPFIDRAAARASVKLLRGHENPAVKDDDWTRDSDQYAFIEAGIPGLYFGVEDYDQHHQPTDDFATITQDFYVRAVDTLIAVVEEFDAGAEVLVGVRAGDGRPSPPPVR